MDYPIIDLHQDLLCHITRRDLFPSDEWQTNFEMIKQNDLRLVIATAFPVPPEENYFDPISNQIIEEEFLTYEKKTKDDLAWMLIRTGKDVDQVLTDPKQTGLLLHIEGLNVVDEQSWDRLESWYQIGWRSLGIVWNLTNPLGGGTKDPVQGLKPLGEQMIRWCESKGMVVDFAHMNEPTFWDATKIVTRPIYISHGNCRTLCENPRNYTDDQLRAVAESGGVVGVFFAKTFVTGKDRPASIRDVVAHVNHLKDVMGENHIALGTDFGGIITGFVSGLENLDQLSTVFHALRAQGYTESQIEKLCYGNAARVLKSHLL